MSKSLKIVLAVSIVLNICLVGFVLWARGYITHQQFNLAAMNTEASVRGSEHVLEVIESQDSERIKALAESLEQQIIEGKKMAANWRKAAE